MKRNSFRNLLRTLAGSGIIAACLCSCGPRHNTLTEAEIADGWQLLFDGKTLDQWKDFNGDSLTQPWHVVDGCIQAKGGGSDLRGYIVTKKQYENFHAPPEPRFARRQSAGRVELLAHRLRQRTCRALAQRS